ncbi:MAG: hypothetical protein CENE_00483 [Candidatus Celerinatantimonas neptuna]|nr:MAG: hypothetical protein CENE_00483 [Candidatus Celerinatantimonas neptuna]
MESSKLYLDALKSALKPAWGCTEPLTVALASAHARAWCQGDICSLDIEVSANLYKNAAGVFVPGTGMTGLTIAAAAGWFGGDAKAGLEVLAHLESDPLRRAKSMLAHQKVQVRYIEHEDVFYTRLEAHTTDEQCVVKMGGQHDHLVSVELNGGLMLEQPMLCSSISQKLNDGWQVAEIVSFCETVNLDELGVVQQSADLNSALSQAGLKTSYGLAIGLGLQQQQQNGFISNDLSSRAMIASAAASDARMAGATLPAMSNSGSGNQGIAATMPVVAVADAINADFEHRLRALTMSHLLAVYIKKMQTPLSALCAATTAAMGAAAAINWLLGGTLKQIEETIRYMVGDISGIYCDGAKPGCALKVSTGASAAVKAALLGLSGKAPRADGVLEQSVDASLANLGKLTFDSLKATDQQIVHWIAERQSLIVS